MRQAATALALGLSALVAAAAPALAEHEIAGRVVEISFVGDLYVSLDLDGDGLGDVWAKIDLKDSELLDEDGQPVAPAEITVGSLLTLTRYDFEDGYYEVEQAVLGTGDAALGVVLAGRIVSKFEFGESTLVALDFDDDGVGDLVVRVSHAGLITDAAGASLAPAALEVGVLLRVVSQRTAGDGVVNTWHVIAGEGEITLDSFPTVQGVVGSREALGGYIYLTLEPGAGQGPRGQGYGGGSGIPVRLGPQTRVQDEDDRPLSWSSPQMGDRLAVRQYEFVDGYFEAVLITRL